MRRRDLLAFGAALLASGCRVLESPFSGTFKVGLVAPFSGRDSVVGYNTLLGIKLAIKAFNERGGYLGWRCELVAHDDHADGPAGLLQARKLLIDPEVLIVLGHQTNASALTAVDAYREAGVALITLASLDTLVGDGVYRLGPSDGAVADTLARYLPATFRANRVGLASDGAINGRFLDSFSQRWTAAGGITTARETIAPETTFFEPAALRVLDGSPDAIVYSGGIELGTPLYAEIRRISPAVPVILTPAAANPHVMRLSGSPTEMAYAILPAPDPAEVPVAFDFVRLYRSTWGADPLPQAILAYDAALIALAAVSRAIDGGPPARAAVRAAVPAGSEGGISGPLQFDARNERPNAINIYRLLGTRYPGQRQEV